MKYAGMPAGMWLLFSGSFNKHLREVLGYDTSTAKDITAKAKVSRETVVFPPPDGPTSAVTWPCFAMKVTSLRTVFSSS